jgi:hypothetical protein
MGIITAFLVCYYAAAVLPFVGTYYCLAPPKQGNEYSHPVTRLLGFFALCMGPVWLTDWACPLFVSAPTSQSVQSLLEASTALIAVCSLMFGYLLGLKRRKN